MSLIDELAGGDIDLDNLKICDLGVDISSLGWQQSDEGTLCEVIKEGDKYSMNVEEEQWCLRVLDSCRRIHALAVVRLYTAKPGETQWKYCGLFGAAAIVTEADLRMACAHFIRVIDLDGFNPNSSVILQQEIYPGFVYTENTPFFHTFEMTKYIAGLSFASEEQAKVFFDKVTECTIKSAVDVVDEDVDSKEKTFKMVGDVGWRTVDDGLSVKLARKYAGGGITDGTEVSWKKKTDDLPPELKSLLTQAGVVSQPPPGESKAPVEDDKVIDLLKNPTTRRTTISSATDNVKTIGDGITLSWSKNKKALTDDLLKEAANQPIGTSPLKESSSGKDKKKRWLPKRSKK